ncbi:hypothetical protein Tco_0337738 [Tanacetum coccineum]
MQTQESKIDMGKALDADLVDTESIRTDSTVQDDSNRSGNDTDTDDADIRPIYDEEPMAEVQLTAECNIFAIRQQHTEQPKIIVEGRGDQYPETCQVKSPMLDSSPDNQTTEYSKQSLESKIFCSRETIQEKVFAIAALKNDLRKLKGNSVDTKFDKTSVLGKPVLPSLRNQSVVRQPNAFKSERAQMSKQRFASQILKRIPERDRTQQLVMPTSARIQTTTDDSKPNPRSNNQTSRSLPVSKSSRVTITAVPKADHSKSSSSFSDSKNFVCSTCHKCVFNANHDACITKLLKEVNSRAKTQSNKIINSNKPLDQKSYTQKPDRQIFTVDSLQKDFDLHKQGTSINVQKEQSLDLSAGTLRNVNKENLRVWLLDKR